MYAQHKTQARQVLLPSPLMFQGRIFQQGEMNILDFLVKLKMAPSKSEAKRLILQNGVRIGGEVQKDWKKTVKTKKGLIVQVGKRKFIKLA